jgi:c-di-GMP-binding flagellar brake protein YcgR
MTKPSLMEAPDERREFTRFVPADNSFVALRRVRKIGSIKDISLGGLSCDVYVRFEEGEAIRGETATLLPVDIFISGKKVFLINILCRVTYDMIGPEDPPPYSVTIDKRRCGLKFDRLTEDQQKQINRFMEEHTVGND